MSTQEKHIIGVIGDPLAGKGTFYTSLLKHSKEPVGQVVFSHVLKETLTLWHLPHTRKEYQACAAAMNEAFGEDTLAQTVHHRIEETTERIIIVDGVRDEVEVAMLSSFPQNTLVYVTAAPEVRFTRARERREKSDEKDFSYETFLKQHNHPRDAAVVALGKDADVIIENNGTLEEFEEKVKKFYHDMLVPKA